MALKGRESVAFSGRRWRPGLAHARAAHFDPDFVSHPAAGIEQLDHMPARPGQPLRLVAARKLPAVPAVPAPAQAAPLGAESQALVLRRNVRVQRDEGSRRRRGDARRR